MHSDYVIWHINMHIAYVISILNWRLQNMLLLWKCRSQFHYETNFRW